MIIKKIKFRGEEMSNNKSTRKLTREEIEQIIKECREKKENKNKAKKLKPLTEKDKEII